MLLALGQAPVLAASIDVDGATCTLIDAITAANTDAPTGGCTAGELGLDTLNLGAGSTHTLTAANNSTFGANGLPVVSTPITIEGNGSTITRDSSAPAFRIFAIDSGGNLTLNETTVSGGVAAADGVGQFGGGVANLYGTATLTESTVSGNSAGFGGGGVYNRGGTATLTHSTVSGNSAGDYGGGIFSNTDLSAQTTTLTNSTVSGNSADVGGGVFNVGGLTIIEHSTLTGNTAPAGNGSGVASFGDSLTLTRGRASLIAANTNTDVDFVFGSGTNSFDSDGDNLIGDGNATGNFNQTGDTTGVADPGLGPLADNGGPTLTHALAAGSPAIDAVTGTCPPPADDQRGVARPQGAACDIGSVEVMVVLPDLAVGKTDSPDPVAVSGPLTYTVTVNNAGEGEATEVILTDTLPVSVNFVSVSPAGSCGEAGGVVTCDLGDERGERHRHDCGPAHRDRDHHPRGRSHQR